MLNFTILRVPRDGHNTDKRTTFVSALYGDLSSGTTTRCSKTLTWYGGSDIGFFYAKDKNSKFTNFSVRYTICMSRTTNQSTSKMLTSTNYLSWSNALIVTIQCRSITG